MRVAALGRTEILYNSILNLQANGHQIVLIGTWKEAPEYSKTSEDFRQLSEKLGVDYKFFSKPLRARCILRGKLEREIII